MKKCFFLLPVFFLWFPAPHVSAAPSFKYIELKESTVVSLPSDGEKALAVDGGGSIVFDFLKVCAFFRLPKTSFETIQNTYTKDALTLFDDPRFGAHLHLFDRSLPVSLKAGHLSFAASLAKLKNPAPSSAGSLTTSFSTATGLSPSLPALTSTSRCRSASISVSKKGSRLAWNFESTVTEYSLAAVSMSINGRCSLSFFSAPSPLPLVYSAAVTAGSSVLENESETLCKAGGRFEKMRGSCALLETTVSVPFLKTFFAAGFHQNPYNAPVLWVRTKYRFIAPFFLFDCSYFALPTAADHPRCAPLVTLSSDICRTVQSFSANPQFTFPIRGAYDAAVRTGAVFQYQEKVLSDRYASVAELIKGGAAVKLECPAFSLKGEWAQVNIPLSVSECAAPSAIPLRYFDTDISALISLNSLSAVLAFSSKHYPSSQKFRTTDVKDIYSTSVAVTPFSKKQCTLRVLYETTVKNRTQSAYRSEFSLTYRLKTRGFSATVKGGVILPM